MLMRCSLGGDSRFPKTLTRFPNGQCSPSAGLPARRIQHPTRKEGKPQSLNRGLRGFTRIGILIMKAGTLSAKSALSAVQ
jgi:hypothetical protein